MAFLLSNLSPSLIPYTKSPSKDRPPFTQFARFAAAAADVASPLSVAAAVQSPPLQEERQVQTTPGSSSGKPRHQEEEDDFFVNLGLAVRTLREDLPSLFTKDLNYDIYRDDITFEDPLNRFTGIQNYKTIFWALRFHGKVLFKDISLEILRIWQPSEKMILVRWNLRGVPRVPWEAKGQFQGTSRYKLDRNGKIYQHKVDNLAFNFPQQLKPAASVLDLVAACPASPNPTFLWGPVDVHSSSWVEFYRAVRETLDGGGHLVVQDGLLTCC